MIKKLTLITVLSVGLLVFSACQKKTEKESNSNEKQSCESVKWDYKGEERPEKWANLCNGFADCNGKEQSPVNIDKDVVVKKDDAALDLRFSYKQTPVSVLNNGHTIQFNVNGDNTLTVGNETYDLLQYHYHALSEHTVNGEHYPMEVHFVHKGKDGLAVVGIFFEEGENNDLLTKYLSNFPNKKGVFNADETIMLSSLLPEDLSYYHYDGSLTTPPCSEIVDWYVLQEPLKASKEQLEQMSEILHGNYRPVQALNGREIVAN